jgi:predicted RNA binding protein YcfA (HicA-like mRNA interferase family)
LRIAIHSGIEMLTDSRNIIQRLKSDGWTCKRVRGSHHVFKHPERRVTIVVPHPRRSLPIGTVCDIYRNAGWESD